MLLIDVHGEYHFMAEKFDPQEIQKFHLDPILPNYRNELPIIMRLFLQVGVPICQNMIFNIFNRLLVCLN